MGGESRPMSSDFFTILTTAGPDRGKLTAKIWYLAHAGKPAVENFGQKPVWFSVSEAEVSDFWTMEEELTRLVDCPECMAVRSEALPDTDRTCTYRLLKPHADGRKPTFRDRAHYYAVLDFDHHVPADFDPSDGEVGAHYYRSTLPGTFKSTTCWWLLTASAGLKPECRMRLAFWLDQPLDCRQLGLLFANVETDHGLFNPVQGMGLAAPIFRDSLRDPIAERCGVLEGDVDTVEVPDIPEPPKPDPAKAKRQLQEFRTRYGNDWPIAALTEVANKIQATPAASVNPWGGGGRHHALFCGALRISGLIEKDFLPEGESRRILAAAAKNAGISDAETARTIANAFRQGGLS